MVLCFHKDRHPSACTSVITVTIRERLKISYQLRLEYLTQYSKQKKQLRLVHLPEVTAYITMWNRGAHNCHCHSVPPQVEKLQGHVPTG